VLAVPYILLLCRLILSFIFLIWSFGWVATPQAMPNNVADCRTNAFHPLKCNCVIYAPFTGLYGVDRPGHCQSKVALPLLKSFEYFPAHGMHAEKILEGTPISKQGANCDWKPQQQELHNLLIRECVPLDSCAEHCDV
jgi:hypothetical protein